VVDRRREAAAHGLILDGGRTIRGGTERFEIAIDPAKPVRLVLRTGGGPRLSLPRGDRAPGRAAHPRRRRPRARRATLPAPTASGGFAEVAFALPAGARTALHTEASAPYRAFHWFVLQPE